MSSSADRKSEAAVVVQSGFVAWEDPVPIADWRYKTVTLVGHRLSFIAKLLWELVESQPSALRRVFRALVVPKPPAATAVQMRRFVAQLAVDPPGFAGTRTLVVGDVCCSASELQQIGDADVNFLTDYRHCVLVGTSSASISTADLCAMIGREISEFGGIGLAKLLESEKSAAIIRVLDAQYYSVIQFMGSPKYCDAVVGFLEDRGVRRIHDVQQIQEEIRRLRA